MYIVYSEFVLLANPSADLVVPARVTNTLVTATLSSLILAHVIFVLSLILAYAVLIHITIALTHTIQRH